MFFRPKEMQEYCDKLAKNISVNPNIIMKLAVNLRSKGMSDSNIKCRLDQIAKLWEK